ncbi:dUTP diphosphatase [Lysinibacillus pakistanensis]|uniref:dUTPase n=1 Tax=Lysinibacillus pakistanensis TaxID=759811 RepID=A0ABX6DDL4_9BACI|nr:dUTPase [Lysinibacillus pakistanensis]
MSLQNIINAQKELDARIIKEKGLEGKDLTPNTFLALKVELAEFANEGRWFKHWSNDQEPRVSIETVCEFCKGAGKGGLYHSELTGDCRKCAGEGEFYSNPLLEEFVDAVHFFVSIAIQKGWEDVLWVYAEQLDPDEFDGDLTSWFLEMDYFLSLSYIRKFTDEEEAKCKDTFGYLNKEYCFRTAWILFLNIGMNGFGYTWEQIEDAYFAKNKVNHERQENGY